MKHPNFLNAATVASLCAVTLSACGSSAPVPTSPSAVIGVGGNAGADGSTLKTTPPDALGPTDDSPSVSTTPTLTVRAGQGLFFQASALSHRFQVSDSNTFATIVSSGVGAVDVQGLVRYAVSPALAGSTKFFWRARAELDDAVGPWSLVSSFTTAGGTATSPSSPSPTAGPRPADPPAGQRLPLPNLAGIVSSKFSNTSDSCPRGLKYINNPWQDRVIDAFRQLDSRWGYNAKPTRTAADNGGVPVVAAGDEAAYHYSGGRDEGSTEVHLVDMLVGHCGTNPTVGWRVFTGEEPGRWTGAGRF